MNKSVPVIVVAVTILASYCIAQEALDQGKPEAVPVVSKYDKMQKKDLQEEVKKLQKEVLTAEQTARGVGVRAKEAKEAYNSASNDQKPDALLLMLEAGAKSHKSMVAFKQVQSDFDMAKRAYFNLILDEQR